MFGIQVHANFYDPCICVTDRIICQHDLSRDDKSNFCDSPGKQLGRCLEFDFCLHTHFKNGNIRFEDFCHGLHLTHVAQLQNADVTHSFARVRMNSQNSSGNGSPQLGGIGIRISLHDSRFCCDYLFFRDTDIDVANLAKACQLSRRTSNLQLQPVVFPLFLFDHFDRCGISLLQFLLS